MLMNALYDPEELVRQQAERHPERFAAGGKAGIPSASGKWGATHPLLH